MADAPYLLVADIHAHAWSAFSKTDAGGLNSRLHIQLEELLRAADELIRRGGKLMIIAGDLFHVRGSVDPEVFNPVHAAMKSIINRGIDIIAIPGNHDLKGKETTKIGNSFQTMNAIISTSEQYGFEVITIPVVGDNLAFIPWCSTKEKLQEAADDLVKQIGAEGLKYTDLIIHAGIDGVLPGVPAGGLPATKVASWGFKRVFAGHYHNHKVMEDGKVISIGATAHQTWSDIGTKAGYIFVYPDHIEWQASHAPEFVEITGEDDPEEIPLMVDGNYVRVRGMKLSDAEIIKYRKMLEDMGARGVSFQVAREAVVAREGAVAGKASTIDESVDKFIDGLDPLVTFGLAAATPTYIAERIAAVKAECTDVLTHTRSIAA
jgi:DNA repair exonuclease SbcCD nuclease subunit